MSNINGTYIPKSSLKLGNPKSSEYHHIILRQKLSEIVLEGVREKEGKLGEVGDRGNRQGRHPPSESSWWAPEQVQNREASVILNCLQFTLLFLPKT